ncbi:hypothetical protein [Sphaerisporangium sp. TRM90804]|uniref:hypothetical protein n=1 Tax=Sphaerisporangium sp. TRM90804 TaxID=3031113 RepID=UPI002448332B|nr:hypothetical protein [Sphaerisporangium sp. TRM90804]MDH2424725.1 hypothetical protein [Sphaerisporangium sp. TRM90804]
MRMPVRDATKIGATGVTSFSCPAPSTVSGDRLIAWHSSDRASGMVAPSGGWTLLSEANAFAPGVTFRTNVWTRIGTGTNPSSYTFTQGAGGAGVVQIVSMSGASAATPRIAFLTNTGTEAPTPSVTLPAGTGTQLRYATGRSVSGPPEWSTPDGFTEEGFASSSGGVSSTLVSRGIDTPGATGIEVFDSDRLAQGIHGFTVVVPGESQGGGGNPPTPPPSVPALPSGERVVHYTYEFADLLTDELIAKDLDLHGVSYERRIGEPGTFGATVNITDAVTAAKVARIVPRHPEDLSTGPGRTVVHVYRNGIIWGSYIIWSASVSWQGSGPIQVSISGSSLESYLTKVKIREDLTYSSDDQIAIARALLTEMQSTPRYDIGLELQSGTSGVVRDRTYLASESSTYGERLTELANVDAGFEWAIQVIANEDGSRTRHWVWGYPKLGNDATSHKFQQPGAVLSWQEDIDPLRGGTAFQTRGESINDDASTTSEPLVSAVVLAQAHIDAGWAGLDVTVDYGSVSDVDTLDDYATWWATNRAGAVRIHQATVRLPANTSYGPGNLGDTVTLMLVNHWWPIEDGVASFAKSWRVVGMAFTPPSKGSDQETCVLTFAELPEED